ncbi:MAG TPA: putative Ig domain-containing protein [Kineosporiaceae bacterium]|nr:putative Ig domain-containing protein [Kineosporiaceae bacterium]
MALNVTVVWPTAATYVTVFPAGAARPTASNINVGPGAVRANMVIAAPGAGGKVTLFNAQGATDLLVDVMGWYGSGGSYTGQSPQRVLDTRIGQGAAKAAVGPAGSIDVQVAGTAGVPASGVAAVALNLTGTQPSADTYLTVYPSGGAVPTASNLNLEAGQTAAVLAVATVGANGKVSVYNSAGSTQVVADVQGWFTTGGDFVPLTPTRLLDTRTVQSPLCSACETALPRSYGIPANATAVYLSVTAVWPTAPTYLTVYPATASNGRPPLVSNINADAGRVVPNLVVADTRSAMTLIYNSAGNTHVVVDLLGYSSAPSTSDTASATGTAGTPFSLQLSAKGGVGALTWSVLPGTGSLPPGLALNATTGLLTGTPTQGGTYTFTAEATDTVGQTVDVSVTVTIALVLTSVKATGEVGVPYSSGAGTVTGGTAPYTWSLTAGTLASGLSLDPATGVISGTPTAPGGGTITLQVKDGNGGVGSWTGPLWVFPHLAHGVFGWGSSMSVSLGSPTPGQQSPVQVDGLTGIVSVAPAAQGGYALKSDGTVWAWGGGASGQLGNGTSPVFGSSIPVQVSGLSGIVAVGATSADGFAVKPDGTVWGWGAGGPLLGQTTGANSNTPVQIPGLSGITAVAGGPSTAYAVKSDGTVWAWGSGTSGRLGDGTTTVSQPTPVQVTGLPKATAVRGSGSGAYALAADGTVWAWGAGASGQLGNGTMPATSAVPVQVSGLTGVTALAAGNLTAYALKPDGTVWSWGAGTNGQLGNSWLGNSAVPVQVKVSGITSIAASSSSAYALASDGRLWGWGWNGNGNLGNSQPASMTNQTPAVADLVPPLTAVYAQSGTPAFGIGIA